MQIRVQIANPDPGMPRSISVDVAYNWNVERIFDQINKDLSMDSKHARVRLFGVGKELRPEVPVHQYNLETGMTLQCTLRPPKEAKDVVGFIFALRIR
jgi:hypothetical protein